MESKFLKQFKAARRVSTPIVCVRTPDPAATINLISTETKDFPQNKPNPFIVWDVVNGLRGLSEFSKDILQQALGDKEQAATGNPVEALITASALPPCSVVFFQNAHKFVNEIPISQAIWNLRDRFKQDNRTLVLLCPQITLPAELANDVVILDEPLPTIPELETIVKELYEYGEIKAPSQETLSKATDALCGLAAFPAEQVTSMSMGKDGVDLESLWERKRTAIEQTPGLSVWRGGETFEDVGGVQNIKTFLNRVLNGEEPPRAVVFIDEIEKSMAGSQGDTSGVSQEMLGTLLTWMEDEKATGMIFIGPPGCSKSLVAKATGATANIPTIAFDLSGMKASLVGESGNRIREALKVVKAVSQGRALFIATCNSIGVLPPELRRRFTFGTFFYDLPTAEERKAIWKIYQAKYSLADAKLPNDNDWTGAEIKQCCNLAYRLKCSLAEAATYIVPVAKSSAESINKLREQANGRFISASTAGVYRTEKEAPVQSNTGRKLNLAN